MESDVLRTKRLLLRPFRESDLDDLYEFLAQLEHDEFEGYPGITRENCAEHLKYRLDPEAFLAVVLPGTGKVIGNVYRGKQDFDAREVGYIINRDYRRRGYALEALAAVVGDVFRRGAHRVYAECDPRNEASWRLLERAGLKREAHLRQNIFFHRDGAGAPIWKDTYVYAMLESDEAAPSARTAEADAGAGCPSESGPGDRPAGALSGP